MKMAKRFLSALLSLCLVLGMIPSTALAVSSNFPFMDVNTTDWFYDAVKYVYDKGMMTGTSSTQFSPSGTATRGMIVTVLHRMEGTPAASDAVFTDVPAGQWYSDAVAWASANGIVSGYGDGLFGPNDAITREQMASILYRYSPHKGYDTDTSNSVSAFSDAVEISSYAIDAMGWAIGSELISGIGNNTLDPKGNATRAQIATILMRYCERVIPSGSSAPDVSTAEEKTYTVTFDLNYGNNSAYSTQTVAEGKTVSKPSNPSRSGYDFNGWYAAKSGGSRFDFSSKITSDLTLYAHWGEVALEAGDVSDSTIPSTSYRTNVVTFYANGNNVENMPQTQWVVNGDTAKAPNPPIRSGYEFVGWFEDNCAGIYDFSAKVTSNLSLYAQWKKKCDGDTIYVPSKNALAYDASTYVKYYNNLLLAYTNSDLDDDDANELAASVGGIIVGDISGAINMLQILVNPTNLEELEYLASQLMSSGKAYYASYDVPLELSENGVYQDNNPWSNDPQTPESDRGNEATPNGTDWWAEAIGAYTAWSYSDIYSEPVTIGVIDSGFELNHAELKDRISFLDSFPENSVNNHGTNIAGILAAANNGEGIRGVADKANLVCADWTPITDDETSAEYRQFTTSEYIAVIKQMIERESVRVINMSLGSSPDSKETFEANKGKYWYLNLIGGAITGAISPIPLSYDSYLKGKQKDADKQAEQCIAMMIGLLENGYNDFLFVQSAGNGYDNAGKQGCSVELNGFFCSVNSRTFNNTKISGKFQYADIEKHIMVVGGSSKVRDEKGNYESKKGFSLGPEVDICAPSIIIFTTDCNNNYAMVGEGGTSLAAPMVAGSAALLWSINPTLKTETVYDFLVDNTPFYAIDGNNKYPMLNVGQAVKSVIDTLPTYSGEIVDANTGVPVSAKITVLKGGTDQIVTTCTSNASGAYTLPKLPSGIYILNIEANGYKPTSEIVEATYSEHSLGKIGLVPISSPLLAPRISGIVNEASTGTALDSVDVYVYDEDGFGPFFTGRTDSDGAFYIELEKNGTYNLKFFKDGYEDYDLNDLSVTGETPIGTILLVSTGSTMFDGGDGTEADPYQIRTAEQLDAVRNNMAGHYKLIADIDLSNFGSWTPIGTGESQFSGSLDGQGHKIIGLTINNTSVSDWISAHTDTVENVSVGLFGELDSNASCSNIEFIDYQVNITETGYPIYSGAVAGSIPFANKSHITISNCTVDGSISILNGDMYGVQVGGIIGNGTWCSYVNISNCHNAANIVVRSYNSICGGIAGYMNNATFRDCTNTADVTSTSQGSAGRAGGIVGDASFSAIYSCINRGNVISTVSEFKVYFSDGTNSSAGGITGSTGSTISQCENYGNVTADMQKDGSSSAGGISGHQSTSSTGFISECKNYGESITAVYHLKVDDIWEPRDGFAARICGYASRGFSGMLSDNYSISIAKVNGSIPDEYIGANEINGANISS